MPPFTLTEIWIYPIKSLGGVSLHEAKVLKKGLLYDRRWMLIDRNNVSMTQRSHPEMALFKPYITEKEISIDLKKNGAVISSVSFNLLTPPAAKLIEATVWDDVVKVLEVDSRISEWFSAHLMTDCKLVSFPEENSRRVDPRYSTNNDQVSLADAYPFLIIGQSSLDDLNRRLPHPVPMKRFRPNFVFTGGDPYLEDEWRNFSIGKIRFSAVKKSDRCVVTTINQETAEKGSEPLHTLSAYRKVGNKVYFGQNLLTLDEGEVSVGDAIIPA